MQNENVKKWCNLKQKKYRDEIKQFLIEGEHLVKMALLNKLVTTLIYVNEKPTYFTDEYPTYEVSYQVMEKITNTKTPQNVAAICNYLNVQEINDNDKRIVALDNVQDPGNGGTIIRTALAFDYDAILLSENSFDIYNDKFVRSSMGAIFDIKLISGNLLEKLLLLKANKYDIIVTALNKNSISYLDYKPSDKFVIVLGNEGNGVSKEVMSLATKVVYIPISDKIDSLNVSIAGAICMAKFMEK
jgi:TrmH family RNA methyltransferase